MLGHEGAGKSAFINYAGVEYPISELFESYKKSHPSTTNFNLYISKDGAIIDTEGISFSRENLYTPTATDEIAEDDMEKNREFLVKKRVWSKFLSFLKNLKKNIFRSKLDAVILVIDTQKFIESDKYYQDETIKFLVRRISECENSLKICFPIYVVFSKIDLIDGMGDYFKIFKEDSFNKAFGVTFKEKDEINNLNENFKSLSESMNYAFMSNNLLFYSIEEKKKAYLFYKQMDSLFSLAEKFILNLNRQNGLKNSSAIKGVYFASPYQENIPKNYILDAICDHYDIKRPLVRPYFNHIKKNYFTSSFSRLIYFLSPTFC